MNENNSKQVLLSVLGVAILVVAVIGVSFAAFSYSKTGAKVNTITTGVINMNYTESSNIIKLTNALPISDATGKALSDANEYFDFSVGATITGSGTTTINYTITAKPDTTSGANTLPETAIKVYLTDMDASDKQILAPTVLSSLSKTSSDNSGAPDGEYILKADTFTSTLTRNYRLRMWVADTYAGAGGNAGITSLTYKLRVNVYGKAAAQ